MLTNDLFPEVKAAIEEVPDERYTTRETLDLCMRLAKVDAFDLDVAATAESAKAPKFYAIADNGLEQPWMGRVWCNPPFSEIKPWVVKAWAEMTRGAEVIAMLLPSTRTEQEWWQQWVEDARDRRIVGRAQLRTHFLPGRVAFGHPGNPNGIGVGSPPFSCVLLVWRRT